MAGELDTEGQGRLEAEADPDSVPGTSVVVGGGGKMVSVGRSLRDTEDDAVTREGGGGDGHTAPSAAARRAPKGGSSAPLSSA